MLRFRIDSKLLLCLLLSFYLSIDAFAAFKNTGTGRGGRVIDPKNPSYSYLSADFSARRFGYASVADMARANALGYKKSLTDSELWAEAKGLTINPHSPFGAFMVPGTGGGSLVPASLNQYASDCMTVYAKLCSNLMSSEFKSVKDKHHSALIAGWSSFTHQNSAGGEGWTASEWADAQPLGYTSNFGDYALYTSAKLDNANASACAAIPGAITGSGVCATISKNDYENINSGIDKVRAVVNAAPLTKGLVLALGLTTPTGVNLDNPFTIEYLDEIITSASGTYPADLLNELSSAQPSTVALWKLSQILADPVAHPPSLATLTLFDEAIGATITQSILNFDPATGLDDLIAALPSADPSITASSNDVRDFVIDIAGFSSHTSYQNWQNNPDNASFQPTQWEECYQSTASGENQCSISQSEWANLDDVISDLENGNLAGISGNELVNIAMAEGIGTSLSLSGAGTNPIHLDFVRACLDALSASQQTSQNIANCVDGSLADASAFGVVGKIDGTYGGAIGVDELQMAQVAGNITNALAAGEGCGADGSTSCLNVFNTQRASTDCTTPSTSGSAIGSFVRCVITESQTAVADAASYSGATNVKAGCSNTPSLPLPGACAYTSYWNCTLINAPSGWQVSSDGAQIAIPETGNNTTGIVSFTLRMQVRNTPLSNPYTRDITITQNVSAAFSDATSGKKQFAIDGYAYKETSGNYSFNFGVNPAQGYATQVSAMDLTMVRRFCRSLGGEMGNRADHESFGVNLINYVYANAGLNWSNLYTTPCPASSITQWACTNIDSCAIDGAQGRAFRANTCARPDGYNASRDGTYVTCVNLPTCS